MSAPFTRIAWVEVVRSASISGSRASIVSAAALAVAARAEGKAAVRPINATSHWHSGTAAGSYEGVDATHTGIGYLTNHVASIFWATFFEEWRARRPPVGPLPMLRDAMILSALAAAVDYGATPKRFTPGWELVLSKKGMPVGWVLVRFGSNRGGDFGNEAAGHGR